MNISTSVQNYTRHFLRGVRKRRKPLGRQAPARLLYWSYIHADIDVKKKIMAVFDTAGHTALQSANRPIDYVNITCINLQLVSFQFHI